jgi:hypothetical protein
MKRSATVLVVALLASGLATSGALAATSKTKWDVVAGTFKTKSAAKSEVSKLSKKKLSGFKAVKSGKQYKVERAFTTQAKAKAELSKLKKDGFKGGKVVKA